MSLRRLGVSEELEADARRIVGWSWLERRRRGRGESPRSWADHAARSVVQGVIGFEDALVSLTALHATLADRQGIHARRLASPTERRTSDMRFCAWLLVDAVDRLQQQRNRLAAEMRRAVEPLLSRFAATDELLQHLATLNVQAGRLFISPELLEILQTTTARWISVQRRQQGLQRNG